MKEQRNQFLVVGVFLVLFSLLAGGFLWLIDARLDTCIASLIFGALVWMLFGAWIGMAIGWDECVESLRQRGVPMQSECAWCHAVLAPGIEPVSHGICEPCGEAHFNEKLPTDGRETKCAA